MAGVLGVLRDRGAITDADAAQLTADDVTDLYGRVANAIDLLEGDLSGR